MYRILDDCGINDLKHPQLFAKADLLAQVAHTLRVDNPTQTELVGRLIDVKAEAVKAPLKKYILAKQVDTPQHSSIITLSPGTCYLLTTTLRVKQRLAVASYSIEYFIQMGIV